MDTCTLRAWHAHRQGLDGSWTGIGAAEVLRRAGWARSVGGVNPYLTLFSRAGIRRAEAERAVAEQDIHELPSARGCTYFVPREDYALALRLAADAGDETTLRLAKTKFDLSDLELENLQVGVVDALADGPLDPAGLKKRLGDRVRTFPPEAKKRGLTTTLPLALGRLQIAGRIRRVPVDGRLDGQRFAYARWSPSPLEGQPTDPAGVHADLARKYFKWIGPASLAHFRWFSGLGAKAAAAAIAPLGLEPIAPGSELLLLPEDRSAFAEFQAPQRPDYRLVASTDALFLHQRDLALRLADADLARLPPRRAGDLQDLDSHGIVDRGRLVGLWEFDPSEGRIVWRTWVPVDDALREAVTTTEAFIRGELGDARSFSLDSPSSRAPRMEALREEAQPTTL